MSMTVGGSRKLSANMNVTPLIDVLLVLLVIFMIITPLAPRGEDARIPQPASTTEATPPPARTVVLRVLHESRGEARLMLNEEPVAWLELRTRLREIYKLRAEKVMFVAGDETIDWQQVAEAISEAHLAGVDQVVLITQKPAAKAAEASLIAAQ